MEKNKNLTKMETTDANNSCKDHLIEENTPELQLQSKDDVIKMNIIADSTNRNFKQKGRKRKHESISGKVDTVQKDVPKKKQHESEKKPSASIRFDYSLGHFLLIDKSRKVRCKNSECNGKTFVSCSICKVHLCVCVNENRNCFTDFHIEKKDQPT